jgi:hypothetical protein
MLIPVDAALAIMPKPRNVKALLRVTCSPPRKPDEIEAVDPRSLAYPTVVGAAHLAVDAQQYCPEPQLLVCPWMQPAAVIVQVRTDVSLAQLLPAEEPQPPLGAGQAQPPDGKLPEQT